MPALQQRLTLILPAPKPRMRVARRPFHPSQSQGPYRLPFAVRDQLAADLAPFRNRRAAYALATFLARFWSAPGRVAGIFPIDRRDLADHPELGLTEAQVRGAIKTLEEIGFLVRAIPPAAKHRRTEEGWMKKAVLYAFGSAYVPFFIKANERAKAARQQKGAQQNSVRRPAIAPLKSPIIKSVAVPHMIMGDLRKIGLPPKAFEPNPKLESALERLRRGVFGVAEGG
jgi:hypothetical protein